MRAQPDRPTAPAGPEDMTGSLRVASLIDLCQFLLLNAKSGVLTIVHGEASTRLFFDGGEIVNAVDDRSGREGREVALALFRFRDGTFRFHQESVHERRRIEEGTENLLLDAARMMDEIDEALPAAGGETSREQELKEKQEKGAALRSLFSSLEEDLTRGAEVAPVEKLLEEAEQGGADGLLLATGHRPALLRGGRVLKGMSGRVGPSDLERVYGRLDGRSEIVVGGAIYRLFGDPGEGRLAFRRSSRSAPALEELNLAPAAVKSLFLRPPGLLFLVADADGVRRYLYEGIIRHLDRIGEVVVCIDEPFGEEGKGFLVHQPMRAGREEDEASLQRLLGGTTGARVAFPRIRNEEDARLLLDLARAGHGVVTTLPGREGGEALRRAASWFTPDGPPATIAPLIAGVLSLQLHAGGGAGRALPVTSVAPWNEDAAAALTAGAYRAVSAALERSAGEHGFLGSLERLIRGNKTEKSEADRIASLLTTLLGLTPEPASARS